MLTAEELEVGWIDITGIDPADLLAALYNRSSPRGMGFVRFDPTPMTREQAVGLLVSKSYFDYLYGRVIKVDFRDPDRVQSRLYDREIGVGTVQAVIDQLRAQPEKQQHEN